VEQTASWAAPLLTSPAGWINACLVVAGFLFVRFRGLAIDETYGLFIGLVESAAERAASSFVPDKISATTQRGEGTSQLVAHDSRNEHERPGRSGLTGTFTVNGVRAPKAAQRSGG
jgi:hypothetical protein